MQTTLFRTTIVVLKFIFLFIDCSYGNDRNTIIDSLKQELKYNHHDTILADINNDLAYYLLAQNVDSSVFYVKKGLHLSMVNGHKKGVAASYNYLGYAFQKIGENDSALHYKLLSLKLFREINNPINVGVALNNLGEFYRESGDTENAIQCYTEALKIFQDLDKPINLSRIYNNLSIAYVSQEKFDTALHLLNSSIEIKTKHEDEAGIASSYTGISKIYYLKEDYDKAMEYNELALGLAKKTGQSDLESFCFHNLGNISILQGKYELAINYLDSGLKIADSINNINYQGDFLLALATAYDSIGQYSMSLTYYRRYTEIVTLIYDETKSNKIAELTSKYQVRELQRNLQIKEIQHQQDQSEKILLTIVIVFLAVLLTLTAILFISNRRKNIQRHKLEIEKFNRELDILQAKIETGSPRLKPKITNFETVNMGLKVPLTRVEFDTLLLLSKGYTNDELAADLYISKGGVQDRIKSILSKLDAKNRTHAVGKFTTLADVDSND